jgi:sedoheptulose-bisphosphatase
VSGLDVPITAYDQRTEICYGSVGEVRRFEEYLYGGWGGGGRVGGLSFV